VLEKRREQAMVSASLEFIKAKASTDQQLAPHFARDLCLQAIEKFNAQGKPITVQSIRKRASRADLRED
jgi:hypothetical protein